MISKKQSRTKKIKYENNCNSKWDKCSRKRDSSNKEIKDSNNNSREKPINIWSCRKGEWRKRSKRKYRKLRKWKCWMPKTYKKGEGWRKRLSKKRWNKKWKIKLLPLSKLTPLFKTHLKLTKSKHLVGKVSSNCQTKRQFHKIHLPPKYKKGLTQEYRNSFFKINEKKTSSATIDRKIYKQLLIKFADSNNKSISRIIYLRDKCKKSDYNPKWLRMRKKRRKLKYKIWKISWKRKWRMIIKGYF